MVNVHANPALTPALRATGFGGYLSEGGERRVLQDQVTTARQLQ